VYEREIVMDKVKVMDGGKDGDAFIAQIVK
jgi:hypothetical protein